MPIQHILLDWRSTDQHSKFPIWIRGMFLPSISRLCHAPSRHDVSKSKVSARPHPVSTFVNKTLSAVWRLLQANTDPQRNAKSEAEYKEYKEYSAATILKAGLTPLSKPRPCQKQSLGGTLGAHQRSANQRSGRLPIDPTQRCFLEKKRAKGPTCATRWLALRPLRTLRKRPRQRAQTLWSIEGVAVWQVFPASGNRGRMGSHDQTTTVRLTVQIIVVPYKGVYSLRTSLEGVEEPETTKESKVPPSKPRPSGGFGSWVREALLLSWKKQGRDRAREVKPAEGPSCSTVFAAQLCLRLDRYSIWLDGPKRNYNRWYPLRANYFCSNWQYWHKLGTNFDRNGPRNGPAPVSSALCSTKQTSETQRTPIWSKCPIQPIIHIRRPQSSISETWREAFHHCWSHF